jgi:uncharacterized protein (TIGR00369 family)
MQESQQTVTAEQLRAEGWKPYTLPGHMGQLGPLWIRKGTDEQPWRFGLQAQAQHLNPQGMVHGGVTLSLLDQAVSTVAWEMSGRTPCVTVQLDTQFIAAVKAGDFAVVSVYPAQRTSSLVFARAELHVGTGLAASAQAILKLLRPAAAS